LRRPAGDGYNQPVKICDLTQFYSPLSGGVKRYVHEKIAFIENHSPDDAHVLIVPGERTELVSNARSRIYSIHSPLLSRTSRYRALLNLRAVAEILERERPDIIESSDPYQVGWKAVSEGRSLRIPVVAFYHSHFPEAYLRSSARFLGQRATVQVMKWARAYVKKLYNQFQATLVPSEALAAVLQAWGVANVRPIHLGVNTEIFKPEPNDALSTRDSLGIPTDRKLLLYVGRLAKEKNTQQLFGAFDLLRRRHPGDFHLLIVGDGPHRDHLIELQRQSSDVSWISYCTDSLELARYYRAADLFVHPGVQETFGLVALESQACGTPVVGISGSYMDRIILHEQGWWARENTKEALADAVEESSEKKLSTLGDYAAQAASELYSWPRVFGQLFCIYRDVCANYRNFDGDDG
jgi:alpha-1,6-mannosyltransferase